MRLRVATCQFPVSADIERNCRCILSQVREAGSRGADIAHFPESSLGGYPGVDIRSFAGYDWDLLRLCAEEVAAAARRAGLWVVLGSHHRLMRGHRPHNSAYLINARGGLYDRYDKRFCMWDAELKHFTPGSRPVTFALNGVRCGLLICHEWRYPEVYRQYRRMGVQAIFQSFYDGGLPVASYKGGGRLLGEVIPATVRAHAVCNRFWISAANTSRRESCFGSFVVRPDGSMAKVARRNVASVLISDIAPLREFYDPAARGRERAARGILHTGTCVKDPRSDDRRSF